MNSKNIHNVQCIVPQKGHIHVSLPWVGSLKIDNHNLNIHNTNYIIRVMAHVLHT